VTAPSEVSHPRRPWAVIMAEPTTGAPSVVGSPMITGTGGG